MLKHAKTTRQKAVICTPCGANLYPLYPQLLKVGGNVPPTSYGGAAPDLLTLKPGFSSSKKLMTVLVLAKIIQAITTKLTTPNVQISPISKKIHSSSA